MSELVLDGALERMQAQTPRDAEVNELFCLHLGAGFIFEGLVEIAQTSGEAGDTPAARASAALSEAVESGDIPRFGHVISLPAPWFVVNAVNKHGGRFRYDPDRTFAVLSGPAIDEPAAEVA